MDAIIEALISAGLWPDQTRVIRPLIEAYAAAAAERERREHLATQELHERSMQIIEDALGPKRPDRNTWRAQAIADDIRALRATIKIHGQN